MLDVMSKYVKNVTIAPGQIFAANSPDSGEYMANGLTNAIRHQSQ